ncbi:uncharacterized protein RCC_12058 [Ramularia collo-cygni]|uniref:Uncharacterized protein n=1 Tax=Ramularia collo-cygni TaxID=112498 RepID=A0A2D3ULK0_9PEZI|nr:uncharacterized protein RCC_12058 [Ramularia collo-cygni]CZT15022.1 uncharacterized protein RCC_12058 [Ramularia collo-cygni]
MSTSAPIVKQLHTGLQTLPQEIYDKIYTLTFAYDAEEEACIITQDYKPPFQLQIDRKTRAAFIKKYYGRAAPFCIQAYGKSDPKLGTFTTNLQLAIYRQPLKLWLESLGDDALGEVLKRGKGTSHDTQRGLLGTLDFIGIGERAYLYRAYYRRVSKLFRADYLELGRVFDGDSGGPGGSAAGTARGNARR